MYEPTTRCSKHEIKYAVTKRKIHKSTTIVRNFNTLLSKMDRTRQNITKDIQY